MADVKTGPYQYCADTDAAQGSSGEVSPVYGTDTTLDLIG
jgi:hypothetical protein